MNRKIIIPIAAALFLAAVFFLRPSLDTPGLYKETEFIMGTYVTIQVERRNPEVTAAVRKAFEEVKNVDAKFSTYRPESPVSDFNENSAPVNDPEIIGLAGRARQISVKSGGVFDITVKPLVELWGFYGDSPAEPSRKDIERAAELADYRLLNIEDGILAKKKEGVEIDFGGIAKGYAVDRAVQSLKEAGIESALVDAGGDIFALGTVDGRPWKIGLRDPRRDGISGIIEVSDKAVVTSGDYEKFFISNGKRYSHIINPVTGYPAGELNSVTVIAGSAETADGWATAILAAGQEKGLKLIRENPAIEGIIINESGEIFYSAGAGTMLTLKKK
ncbi:MAG: FAD:protein FMN transferase [Elusimicrobiota bacterium]|nr:FAD:protein FMN transferase [Elusimicrobiota bacterium]